MISVLSFIVAIDVEHFVILVFSFKVSLGIEPKIIENGASAPFYVVFFHRTII